MNKGGINQKDEYLTRQNETTKLQTDRLLRMGNQNKDYDYLEEMKNSKMNPIKYDKFKPSDPPSYDFEMELVFNPVLNSDYTNYEIDTLIHKELYVIDVNRKKDVPTPMVARNKDQESEVDKKFGAVLASGNIKAKKHFTGDINKLMAWEPYFYVLRKYTFYFYKSETASSQDFELEIVEKSIDTNMENIEAFAVSDNFYVKKDKSSKQFRQLVTTIAYWRSYLMVLRLARPASSQAGQRFHGERQRHTHHGVPKIQAKGLQSFQERKLDHLHLPEYSPLEDPGEDQIKVRRDLLPQRHDVHAELPLHQRSHVFPQDQHRSSAQPPLETVSPC